MLFLTCKRFCSAKATWMAHVSQLTLYSLTFLWCRPLTVFAETSLHSDFNPCCTSSFLFAPSLLPLDPPSHGNIALSYPNKLLMRPNLNFHTQTHVHTSECSTHACTLKPDPFSGWCFGPSWLWYRNLLSICLIFYTSQSLLYPPSSSFPAPLSLGRRVWMCLWSLKPLESGTTTQIASRGDTDRMDTVT